MRNSRWLSLALVALAAMFVAPPPPARADECSELAAAIRQLDQQIANMGSAGTSGGGSTGQAGALRDARNNYQNAYNAMNCANGGSNQSYQAPQRNTGMDALVLGAGILDNMINAQRERDRQDDLRREAERRRAEAERQRQEAETNLAIQRAREADARMRNATANPFDGAGAGGNPFGTSSTNAADRIMDAHTRAIVNDLSSHGISGCPTSEAVVGYCRFRPPWWAESYRTYSPETCASYVSAQMSSTPACELQYRATLRRSQNSVRDQAETAREQRSCAENPFAEGC